LTVSLSRSESRAMAASFSTSSRSAVRNRAPTSGWSSKAGLPVVVEAAGDPESIRRFEELLRQGPHAARVERLHVRELSAPPDAAGFEVRF